MPDPTQASGQIPLIDQNGQAGLVDADKVDAALATGKYQRAAKMVDQNGSVGYVAEDKVAAARQAKFAVAPDSPGVRKMVTPSGQVNYALPSEIDSFKKAGHTLIEPDGMFYLQNIRGEDPLEEAKRYQRVRAALTPEEQEGLHKGEMKGFAKAGLEAGLYTAGGVAGAGAAGAAGEALNAARPIVTQAGTGILDSTGAEIMKDVTTYGPSIMEKLGPHAIKLAIGGGASALGVKWLGKVLGSLGLGVAANAAWDKVK